MPQAIEVKGQAEQHRLANLHWQAATGSFRREFAFDHREDRFHFRAWRVQFLRERAVHLIADGSFRNAASGVGRDYALGSERAADMPVIGFGIELGISQHQPDWRDTASRVHQARQSGGIAPGTLTGSLRQNDLAIDIGKHHHFRKWR